MRNIMKHSGARNAKVRRSVRGLSAVLASLALTAGLGSYPAEVEAQESGVNADMVSEETVDVDSPIQTATAPEVAESTSVDVEPTETSSLAAPEESAAEQSPVQVLRTEGVDLVTVNDPDGEVWGYGAKASPEDIFAIKRVGEGEIEEILRLTIDGQDLEPEFYGYANTEEGGYLAFDLDALCEVPPREVEFEVRTSGEADYAIAESEEVPSARELSASGYGKNADAAATVNPDGVGLARAAGENKESEVGIESTTYRALAGQSTGRRLDAKVQSVASNPAYLTRLTIDYSYGRAPGDRMQDLSGPVTVQVGQQSVTVDGRNVTPRYANSPSGARKVVGLDVTIPTDARVQVRRQDTLSVNFSSGPAAPNGSKDSYTLRAWSSPTGNDIVVPGETGQCAPYGFGGSVPDMSYDTNRRIKRGRLSDGSNELDMSAPLGKRELSPREIEEGFKVYVSTSRNAQNQSGNRDDMVYTSLDIQRQGEARFENVGYSRWIYNGLAYDPADNWLYAISQYRGQDTSCYVSGNLLQINPQTGQVRNLGPVMAQNDTLLFAKGSPGANDFRLINTGTIDDGYLYVSNSSTSGTKSIYRIPLPSRAGVNGYVPRGTRMDGGNTSSDNWKFFSEDVAVLANDPGYAWGVVSSALVGRTGANINFVVERRNLKDGTVTFYPLSRSQLTSPSGDAISAQTTWGKAWAYPNGDLGVAVGGQSSSGAGGARIRITQGRSGPSIQVVETLKDLPFSFNTDAASNGRRTPQIATDLQLVKQELTGTEVAEVAAEEIRREFTSGPNANPANYSVWSIKLTNNGPAVSSGSSITDTLPDGYDMATFRQFDSETSSGRYVPVNMAVNGHTVVWSVGVLNPGESVTLYMYAAVGPNAVCSPNTATVENHDIESKPGNNSSTAACPPKLDVSKQVVAEQRDPRANGGVMSIDYNVVVTNRSENGVPAQAYELVDTPRFASSVQVTKVQVADGPNSSRLRDVTAAAPFVISRGQTIASGQTHTYRVHIEYAQNREVEADQIDQARCAGSRTDQPNGLYNETTVTWLGDRTASAWDCKDVPQADLVVSKKVARAAQLDQNGRGTIEYTIDVANPSGLATFYNLNDIPRFAQLVNITGVEVKTPSSTAFTTVSARNGEYPLASRSRIEGGQTHTYTVRVAFNLAMSASSDTYSQEKCIGGQTTQPNGLYNEAALNWAGGSASASDCQDVPRPSVDLVFQKNQITRSNEAEFQNYLSERLGREYESGRIYWAITVKNNGPAASRGFVVTDQVPASYSDVRTHQWIADNQSTMSGITVNPSVRGNVVTWDVTGPVPVGQELMLVVSARTNTPGVCEANEASLTPRDDDPTPQGDEPRGEVDECTPRFDVRKQAVSSSYTAPTEDTNGSFTVSYDIVVENNGTAPLEFDPIVEKPQVPAGLTVTGYSVTRTDEFGIQNSTTRCSWSGGGDDRYPGLPAGAVEFRLDDCRSPGSDWRGYAGRLLNNPGREDAEKDRAISPRGTRGGLFDPKSYSTAGEVSNGRHVYNVTFKYSVSNGYTAPSSDKCEASNGFIVNKVAVNGRDDTDCTPVTKAEGTRVRIIKMGQNGDSPQNLSNLGVEFTVFEDQALTQTVTGFKPADGYLLSEASLGLGKTYYLAETKAAPGFSLLPTAIPFEITNSGDGPIFKLLAEGVSVTSTGVTDGQPTITVANIRQGNLPRTGGAGLLVSTLVGFAIVALGVAMGTRRKTA